MREVIVTPSAPSSPAYSQAIKAGGHVYISGTVGIDVGTGKVAGETIQEQTAQSLRNCEHILSAAGATLAHVVEVGVLLADPDDFAGMNEAYGKVFPQDPPARYVAKLGAVIPGVLVSIRMTAVLD
jgi:2-iminobutanoate/2-iminopropanoate deaminase